MFTGIVEEVGEIKAIDRRSSLQRTTVGACIAVEGAKIGDSISINGACHTVLAVSADQFVVESVVETLDRTTMGDLVTGDRVNLERSVRLADRLDGRGGGTQGGIDPENSPPVYYLSC